MTKALFRFDYSTLDRRGVIQFHKIFVAAFTVERALEFFRRDYPAASILQIAQEPSPVIIA